MTDRATNLAQAERLIRERYTRDRFHVDNLFMGALMVDLGLTLLEVKGVHDKVRTQLHADRAMPCPLRMAPDNIAMNRDNHGK